MGKLKGKARARVRKQKNIKEKVARAKYMQKLQSRILTWDAPELEAECQHVRDKDDLLVSVGEGDKAKTLNIATELKKIICSTKNGVGLAANQLGYMRRVFVMREQEGEINHLQIYINPEVVEKNDVELSTKEGCLSYPGFYVEVARSWKIKVKYLDENFKEMEEEIEGLAARIFLHELDHLNGECALSEKALEWFKNNNGECLIGKAWNESEKQETNTTEDEAVTA